MRRPGPDEWQKLIAEYEKSGLQQKEFVAKHDLPFNTFQYWLYKKSKPVRVESGSTTRFVPVEVIKPAPEARRETVISEPALELEIELPSEVRLRFAASTPASYVAELVNALR